jgi:hypothetical protein
MKSMQEITFITGNQGKADYLAKYLDHPVAHRKIDLDEIQSMDLDTVQQQINVVYSVGKKAKSYQLILKSFDEDGNQLGQVIMNPQEEYAQMNAK